MDGPIKTDAPRAPIGIVVLAAGAARRMNEPKQLLPFRGKTLLRRAALAALDTVCRPAVVVLGANFERAKAEIEDLPVEIVFNENWQTGLASSIQKGLETVRRVKPDVSAIMLTLADQPFVTAKHLNRMAEKYQRPDTLIIAARYDRTVGVPAVFSRAVFDDFKRLSGDQGAKPIVEKYRPLVTAFALPEAAYDVDTPEDFQKLADFAEAKDIAVENR